MTNMPNKVYTKHCSIVVSIETSLKDFSMLLDWGHLACSAYRRGDWGEIQSLSISSSQWEVEGQVLISLVTSNRLDQMAWSSVRGVRLGIRKRNRVEQKWSQHQDCQEHWDKALRHMLWCFGLPCAGAGIRLNDPSGPLPAQDILWLYSMIRWIK